MKSVHADLYQDLPEDYPEKLKFIGRKLRLKPNDLEVEPPEDQRFFDLLNVYTDRLSAQQVDFLLKNKVGEISWADENHIQMEFPLGYFGLSSEEDEDEDEELDEDLGDELGEDELDEDLEDSFEALDAEEAGEDLDEEEPEDEDLGDGLGEELDEDLEDSFEALDAEEEKDEKMGDDYVEEFAAYLKKNMSQANQLVTRDKDLEHQGSGENLPVEAKRDLLNIAYEAILKKLGNEAMLPMFRKAIKVLPAYEVQKEWEAIEDGTVSEILEVMVTQNLTSREVEDLQNLFEGLAVPYFRDYKGKVPEEDLDWAHEQIKEFFQGLKRAKLPGSGDRKALPEG